MSRMAGCCYPHAEGAWHQHTSRMWCRRPLPSATDLDEGADQQEAVGQANLNAAQSGRNADAVRGQLGQVVGHDGGGGHGGLQHCTHNQERLAEQHVCQTLHAFGVPEGANLAMRALMTLLGSAEREIIPTRDLLLLRSAVQEPSAAEIELISADSPLQASPSCSDHTSAAGWSCVRRRRRAEARVGG
jgi:hypothetical protein